MPRDFVTSAQEWNQGTDSFLVYTQSNPLGLHQDAARERISFLETCTGDLNPGRPPLGLRAGGRLCAGLAHLWPDLSLFGYLAIGNEHGEQHRHVSNGVSHS